LLVIHLACSHFLCPKFIPRALIGAFSDTTAWVHVVFTGPGASSRHPLPRSCSGTRTCPRKWCSRNSRHRSGYCGAPGRNQRTGPPAGSEERCSLPPYSSPAKPMNASERLPAMISVRPVPFAIAGISESSLVSRIEAISTSASVRPRPAPTAKVRPWRKS
jgi:hypothetical protein